MNNFLCLFFSSVIRCSILIVHVWLLLIHCTSSLVCQIPHVLPDLITCLPVDFICESCTGFNDRDLIVSPADFVWMQSTYQVINDECISYFSSVILGVSCIWIPIQYICSAPWDLESQVVTDLSWRLNWADTFCALIISSSLIQIDFCLDYSFCVSSCVWMICVCLSGMNHNKILYLLWFICSLQLLTFCNSDTHSIRSSHALISISI